MIAGRKNARGRPGKSLKELVGRLLVSEEVMGYHLRKLVREGRLLCMKIGRTRHYYPAGQSNEVASLPVVNY
jgi:predicted transcriptional regulator